MISIPVKIFILAASVFVSFYIYDLVLRLVGPIVMYEGRKELKPQVLRGLYISVTILGFAAIILIMAFNVFLFKGPY